ncbi:WD40 repeat [Microbispora rosea]|uniref:WD40 repeat n=1 Tax=Microbispora rosea TaxID=58117 RepID=A0A1N7GIK5_9ACTN|nr:AAA family ATPase [Microbispora rosea]GIH51657.1 hypothetical protein Mro03_68360 [Microbispora rosea subsp. rosea]SIS12424.1 WD40 repeat [Microbispora rosea]
MSRPSEQPPDPQHAGPHFQAEASGESKVYQAGRDQHFYYQDGVRQRRRAHPGQASDRCPYPGLAAFGPEQARWFFGRDRLLAELTARLDERARSGGPLMVVAPSGAGKSSLLRAGLLPALEDGALSGSRHWPQLLFTPGAQPMAALTKTLERLPGIDPGQVSEAIAAEAQQCAWMLHERFTARDADPDVVGPRMIVVVDQLEELFTQCEDEPERHRFIEALAQLASPGFGGTRPVALVVCGLRSDFYTHCADYPLLRAALQDGQVFVGPMSQEELREAIQYPARDVGLEIEPGLVELLLRDLGATTGNGYETGRLPLLAHALRTTWQQRHGHTLTVEGYRVTGGIQQAVATTAERIFTGLSDADRRMARALFLRLVTIGDDIDDARRRVPRADLLSPDSGTGSAAGVMDAFTQGRLITQTQDTVEITHEALLSAWPRLHEWIRSDRESIDRHRRLGEAARRWAANGRLVEELLRGSTLHAALAWTTSTSLTLNSLEKEFLQRSSAESVRQSRRRKLLAGTLAILLVGALTGGMLAWQQARRSEASNRRLAVSDRRLAEQSAQATARRVALQADALRDSDPVKAMLLSVAAYRIAPVPEARAAVFSALGQQELRGFKDPALANEGRALSIDGRILVSAGADKVTAYDVSTGKTIRTFTGVGQGPFSAALGPDGDTLALGRNGIHLWSLGTGKRLGGGAVVPKSENSGKGDPSELSFSPGGGYLWAYQNRGGPYYALWNVAKRRLEIPPETLPQSEILGVSAAVLGPHDDFGALTIYAGAKESADVLRTFPEGGPVPGKRLPENLPGRILAFSPDATLAVIAGQETDEEKIRLWNMIKGDWGREFYGPSQDAVFSADGTLLVTSGSNQQGTTVALWRVKDGVQLLNLTIDAAIVGSPRISPDNGTLTLLDETGQVTAYDISRYMRAPEVQDADAENREFNATGDALFALADGVLHRWALPDLTQTNLKIKPGTNDEFEELGMAVSPDGRMLATSVLNDSTPKLTLWDIETRRKLRDVTLKEESAEKRELRFSPDGRLLAFSHGQPNDYTGEGGVEIVDVRRRKQVMRFTPVAGDHMSFSADGKTLVTADDGGVDVIDLVKKKLLPRSKGPGTLAKGWMVLAPKGGLAASPYGGRAVALWNTHTWKPTGQLLRLPGNALNGRFSPDGRFLAVAHDTRVTLFDVAGGYQLGAPQVVTVAEAAEDNAIRPVIAFSKDSSVLHVLGGDGTLHELPVAPERVVPEVCRRAGRPLTPAEWQEHVGGEVPYVKTC